MVPIESNYRFKLKFWGVRGSIATPLGENLGYGGNTACVEVCSQGDQSLIIDAGTGLRLLGDELAKEAQGQKLDLSILMTHFHWDHVQGIPFFAPLYRSGNEVSFHSDRPARVLADILEGQMSQPYFPVDFDLLPARRNFVQLDMREVRFGNVMVHSFPLNHPQGASGYRLESDGAVIVHASDHEHGHAKLDRVLLDYAQNADILIYDSQYTDKEYEARRGWGHSTWREATRVASQAGVKRLILFHHDPAHNDAFMTSLASEARNCFENTEVAREGTPICV